MYTQHNFRTKKALREALASGQIVRVLDNGVVPHKTPLTGRVYLEGPHAPAPHSWYAQADVANGVVVRVW